MNTYTTPRKKTIANKDKVPLKNCLRGNYLYVKQVRLAEFGVAVFGSGAEFLFDAEELVVLGHAVGTAHGACLNLTGVGSHCDVGNGGVLGLA